MPIRCVAFNCKNNNQSNSNLSFHSFPRDEKLRNIWITRVNRKDWKPTEYSHLCSEHFENDCYEKDARLYLKFGLRKKCSKLKKDAVPTIFNYNCNSNKVESEGNGFKKRRIKKILNSDIAEFPKTAEEIVEFECETNEIRISDIINKESSGISCQVDMKPLTFSRAVQTGVRKKHSRTQASVALANKGTQTDFCSIPCYIHNESKMDIDNPVDSLDKTYKPTLEDIEDFPEFELPDHTKNSNVSDSGSRDMEPVKERKYIVFESCLLMLFKICTICSSSCIPVLKIIGSSLKVTSTCENGHVLIWYSQPCINRKALGNLLLAAGILFSGSNPKKALHYLSSIGIATISYKLFLKIQKGYLFPAVKMVWQEEQNKIFTQLQKTQIDVHGERHSDISLPSYSTKYGSYSFIESSLNKVIHLELVQSSEVKNSNYMETEALKRGLLHLYFHGLNVSTIITDRHPQIRHYLKADYPEINHFFDYWQIAKGLNKKILASAKCKDCGILKLWAYSIVNHLHWCVISSHGSGDLLEAKWLSILNHIVDIHHGHHFLFPDCEHAECQPSQWLKQDSIAYLKLKSIIQSHSLIRDLKFVSLTEQTYDSDVFHNIITYFTPNSSHYSYEGTLSRLYIAALHYNENFNKQRVIEQNENTRWRIAFSKSHQNNPNDSQAATFDYVRDLFHRLFECCSMCPSYEVI